MITFVLDASAILRLADGEAGATRVSGILLDCSDGKCDIRVSAVNWGEVIYTLKRRPNSEKNLKIAYGIFDLPAEVTPVDVDRAERAALIKLKYELPYADAFALELASDSANHILVTADFDFKAAELLTRIDFLPTKPKQ